MGRDEGNAHLPVPTGENKRRQAVVMEYFVEIIEIYNGDMMMLCPRSTFD